MQRKCKPITGELIDKTMAVTGITIMIFPVLRYDFFNSSNKYIDKYKQESDNSKVLGNIIVVFYVAVSFLSFILLMKHYYNV